MDSAKETLNAPPAPSGPGNLTRELRPIIVIGSGGIVHDAHLPAYRRAGFPVAALVDRDQHKAQALASAFAVPFATTSLDAAIRYAPPGPIFDLAVPAPALLDVLPLLPDGAAVLMQKPMGETLDQAEAILALCRRKSLTAAVNFQLRWSPVMLAARQLHDAGFFGTLHDMEVQISVHMPWKLWTFLASAPRLEILYHSIHYIDLCRAWFQKTHGNPAGVYARTVRSPQTPSLAATKTVIILDYGDWNRVYIATNHGYDFTSPDASPQRSSVQWEGTAGTAHAVMGVNLNYPTGEADSLRYAARPRTTETADHDAPVVLPAGFPTGGHTHSGLITGIGNWFPDAFLGSMGSVQSYVTGESSTLPTSVEDAIFTMRTVEAAYQSSQRGGVPLPAAS